MRYFEPLSEYHSIRLPEVGDIYRIGLSRRDDFPATYILYLGNNRWMVDRKIRRSQGQTEFVIGMIKGKRAILLADET